MAPDLEGFLYPIIDPTKCSDCGRCRQVCPVISPSQGLLAENKPDVFAAWHLDHTVRLASSSGGIFSAFSEHILGLGGVVAGAAFDEHLLVRHVIVGRVEDLARLRGSKYVQSQIETALYRDIQGILRNGRPVLFSGTPCQVAALRRLVGTQDQLFCVDLVCHGVPSPRFWQTHLQQLSSKVGHTVTDSAFRDKTYGWKQYCLRFVFSNGGQVLRRFWEDSYMLAFLKNYSLRPSCYRCRFANLDRQGDLTLGDFWGVKNRYPQYDSDDLGTSIVLVNNPKGKQLLQACPPRIFLGPADLDAALAGNPMLARPASRPPQRDTFYKDLMSLSLTEVYRKYKLRPESLVRRLAAKCYGKIKRLGARCERIISQVMS